MFFILGPHVSLLLRPKLTTSSSDSSWRSSAARVCSAETMSHRALRLALRNSTSSFSFKLVLLLPAPRPTCQYQLCFCFFLSQLSFVNWRSNFTLCVDVVDDCEAQNDDQAEFHNSGPSHLHWNWASKSLSGSSVSRRWRLSECSTEIRLFAVPFELKTE